MPWCYTGRAMAGSNRVSVRLRRMGLLAFVAGGSLACDLETKAWAWDNLRGQASVSVIDPIFELAFAFNTGSAFSIVRDGAAFRTVFIVVAFAAVAWLVWLASKMPTQGRAGFVALGLVAAGALGNLHDRLFRIDELGRHGVVDFMKINYPWGGSWPIFNVADVLLLVGVGLLLLAGWKRASAEDEALGPDAAPS
jgi:signal peptidase II